MNDPNARDALAAWPSEYRVEVVLLYSHIAQPASSCIITIMRSVEVLGLNAQIGGFNQYQRVVNKHTVPEREQELSAFFAAQQQDGVDTMALCDTYAWDKRYGSDKEIAEHLHFDFAMHQPLHDDRLNDLYGDETQVGVTFATNHEVDERESKAIRLEDRDALKAVLMVGGKVLQVVVPYFNELDEEARQREVRALSSREIIDANERVILVSDQNSPPHNLENASVKDRISDLGFRALSLCLGFVPDKDILEEILRMIGHTDKAATIDYYKQAIRGMNLRSVTRLLEKEGFIDADPTHQPTFQRGPIGVQLDRISHKSPPGKPLTVSNFQTISAPSDHKAIRATINL